MAKYSIFLLLTFIATCVQSGVVWETPNNLQPVHGLYVKPSIDGTTGDLYVAATEDNGINSQWLTDQPINFLASATENQEPFISTDSVEIPPQKRAILTAPVKYTQIATDIGNNVYHVPANDEASTPCPHTAPYYSPFQYFYPQILSAIANAYNQKEGENTKPQVAWPQPYPFQYVIVDPRSWAKPISESDISKTYTKDTE